MADIRYKTKDKSKILKKLSKKFITISIKKSFHRIQVDIIPDRFMLRRESNSIVSAKETTSKARGRSFWRLGAPSGTRAGANRQTAPGRAFGHAGGHSGARACVWALGRAFWRPGARSGTWAGILAVAPGR